MCLADLILAYAHGYLAHDTHLLAATRLVCTITGVDRLFQQSQESADSYTKTRMTMGARIMSSTPDRLISAAAG